MKLATIDEIVSVSGKRILLRLSLNVPTRDGQVADDFRIMKVLPTLQTLIDRGALVTVASHLGSDGNESLSPVEEYLRDRVKGDFSILSNLRADPREILDDETMSQELARGQDLYVNEDFAVSHRAHSSVVGVARLLPSYIGYQFAAEVENLSRFLIPVQPCVVILGGIKLETKLPMIKGFLPKAEKIFLGSYFVSQKEHIPLDSKVVLPSSPVLKDGKPIDVGAETISQIKDALKNAGSVIWNGPLGKFEDGYDKTTKEVAQAIAMSQAFSVVGGGDSIAAIRDLGLMDKFTFVSTGGGAMLDFLANGTLPGIEAIINAKR